MKKRMIGFAVMLLALMMICLTAQAESDTVRFFDAAEALLFHTGNVTLKGQADFSLDGEWFKTAIGNWQQDHDRSFRQLTLVSPRMDGTERRNGYTIVTEGENLYLIEVYHPEVYRTGTAQKRESILRNTVETEQLLRLAQTLAEDAELLLGEGALIQVSGQELKIVVEDGLPELADIALDFFAKFAAKRYFGMDYDHLNAGNTFSLYHYGTITEGILYCTKSVSLRQASLTMTLDEQGNAGKLEGNLSLDLDTLSDGVRRLDIVISAEVSDRGSTLVRRFNPDDYGVTPDAGVMNTEAQENPDEFYPSDEQIEWAVGMARTDWYRAAFEVPADQYASVVWAEDTSTVTFYDIDGQEDRISMNREDGTLLWMQNLKNRWLNQDDKYHYEPYPDEQKEREIRESLMAFIRDMSPEVTERVHDLKMVWWYEADGEIYAEYNEEPLDQYGDGAALVVRIAPEWRIEYYACISNG